MRWSLSTAVFVPSAPAACWRGTRLTQTRSVVSSPLTERTTSGTAVSSSVLGVVVVPVFEEDEDEDEVVEAVLERYRAGSGNPTQGATSVEIRAMSDRARVARSMASRPDCATFSC